MTIRQGYDPAWAFNKTVPLSWRKGVQRQNTTPVVDSDARQ